MRRKLPATSAEKKKNEGFTKIPLLYGRILASKAAADKLDEVWKLTG